MRGSIICLFIILLVSLSDDVKGQTMNAIPDTINMKEDQQLSFRMISYSFSKSFTKTKVESLPADLYLKNLSFFCNKELQLDKITTIPFRFRLGSVALTDKMEGKNSFNPAQVAH